jgi:sugar/nucleoside kinase (ribokinase family)
MLEATLANFRHIERDAGLWPTDAPTNRVFLHYDERGDRTAHCPNVLPALTERELTADLLSGLDALLINMISGHDVSIDTLEYVLDRAARAGKRPYVHLDLHALVQADLSARIVDDAASTNSTELSGYGREPRGVREWKRWLAIADSIQVNEVEARWFGDPEVQSEEELLDYVRGNRGELRLQSLIVTRAERGATLYDTRRDETHHVPIPEFQVVEPTGSGDVFGAAYTYAISSGSKHRRRYTPAAALRLAVEWATWNATLSTLDELLTAPGPAATP